ncbi:MAG: VCBS repeat-containing protein [Bacteroidota bacterium]
MKTYFFIACLLSLLVQNVFAQKKSRHSNVLPNYNNSLLLESMPDTTANISLGDLDGDGHLDIVLAKGRHWPMIDRVMLGDGHGKIKKAYDLSKVADRSYTSGMADFNGDGFLDIAVSNDNPDKKLVYLNDGEGNFSIGSEFGNPDWPTRNLSIADINNDGLPDIILANRGEIGNTSNYVCLNQGRGKFSGDCIAVAPYPATTIFPTDINKDGFIDLVTPFRDSGQSYVYLGGAGASFSDAQRIPFGPATAAIRMASVADINADGLPDIVTVDEFKGVDIYFGQKDKTFSGGISIADAKVIPYALALADMNKDGYIDIVVGHVQAPSAVYFNDGTGHNFTPVWFGDDHGTVCGIALGDFNEDGTLDIGMGRSGAISVIYFGSDKKKNSK